jgi:choline dehydrogenase-like flavoprotein
MAKDEVYDAIVIGSGATGGWAAKQLTEAGMRVIVLEAGRKLDPEKDFREHAWPYDLAYRNTVDSRRLFSERQPIQSKCYACDEYGHQFFVDDIDNPYTTLESKPFDWFRGRQVGGRTIMWGRQSYRLSDYELKAASHDGYGDDWPISYSDLAPYYDRVESFIGVSGSSESLAQLPDGKFLPAMNMTCGEHLLKRAVEKKWKDRRVTIGRTAMLTASLNGRAKCHYCGHCERGCYTSSYFSSPGSTLPAAESTGLMTLRPNSVVSHLIMDTNTGRARGVGLIDQNTKEAREVFGKIVLLCASTIESTRLLLNSATRQHGAGVGNSSGVLGHYLMDHTTGITLVGAMNQLSKYRYNYDDGRNNGIYIPKFRNLGEKHPGFIRGYGIQASSQRGMLPTNMRGIAGFGSDFKKAVREAQDPAPLYMYGFGEMLAHFDNRVTIDKDKKDAWGIPVPHIECGLGENEYAMSKDIADSMKEMATEAAASILFVRPTPVAPGNGIHEVGTARMGTDPKKSVLNQFNQMWDVKNVFVTDGSCFVSNGCQNPTLTMMAITVRACDYIVDQYKKGDV